VAHLERQLVNRKIRVDNPSPVRGPRLAKRPASWWELHLTFGPRPWTVFAGIDPIWTKLAVGLGLWLVWSLCLGSQWVWSQAVPYLRTRPRQPPIAVRKPLFSMARLG